MVNNKERYLIVTKDQYKNGYYEFHPNKIPNMTIKNYFLICKIDDNRYKVANPKWEE